MIYFWRALCLFALLNLINLYMYDGGAGMEPVWIGIIIGSLILSFKHPYTFLFSKLWFKCLVIGCISLFVIVESFIITHAVLSNSNTPSDFLIVLGARVKGETPSLALKYRMDKAYDYLLIHPDTKAILSGGQGPGEDITEAEAMRRYLTGRGIDESRLILEDRSINTSQNLMNSYALIDTHKKSAEVTVVTSRFHILRSKMIAKDLGKKVSGIGSDTMLYLIPNYYLREFFAVIKEFIL